MVQDDRMRMRMKISDNGIGMSEEFQKVLFEPFTQENRNDVSEQRGTGLGLAIVKKMVTLMGGTISVDSRVGEGTTFVMEGEYPCIRNKELPRNDKMRDAEKNDRGVLHGKRVLVCEDHPMNREIIMALLEKEKMIIDMAEDGEIGEKMFAASAEGYYDIILMDIRMPNQNGYEATAAIRAMKRGDAGTVPIIAMTADAFEQDIQKCLAAGMNGHLPKPISPRQLNDMLVRHLSGMAEKTG
jgi:CheY-like chemotaxis protein